MKNLIDLLIFVTISFYICLCQDLFMIPGENRGFRFKIDENE